jgi:hypothetical protein
MSDINDYIEQALIESIDLMATRSWSWPPGWDMTRKNKFIDQCMIFAETRELYEQCAILRDVRETIK